MAVVREKSDDDKVLVSEETMHVVQRLNVRMVLGELPIGIHFDAQPHRRQAQPDGDRRKRSQHRPAVTNDEASVSPERSRDQGWLLRRPGEVEWFFLRGVHADAE